METRPHTDTTTFADAAATAAMAGARAAAAVARPGKAGGFVTDAARLRIAHPGNGDVDALVARRMC